MTSRGGRNVADRLARFNRRVVNPLVRVVAGRRLSPVALVEHRGRRSGRRYRTPVVAFAVAGGYVVALPYGLDRDWVRNVVTAGACTLHKAGQRVELTEPVVVHGEPGHRGLPRPVRAGLRWLRVGNVLRLSVP